MQYDPPEINIVFKKYSSVLENYLLTNISMTKEKFQSISNDIKQQYTLFLESFSFDFLKVLSKKEVKHCFMNGKEVNNINCEQFKVIYILRLLILMKKKQAYLIKKEKAYIRLKA